MSLFTEVLTLAEVRELAARLPQKREGYAALDALGRALDAFHAAIGPDRPRDPHLSGSQAASATEPFGEVLKRCKATLETCLDDPTVRQHLGQDKTFMALAQCIEDHVMASKEYVLAEHIPPLIRFSRNESVLITLRGAGEAGLQQRALGANAPAPKPHGISAKTIKEGSLLEAYGEAQGNSILEDLRRLNKETGIMIEGLVGHWDPPEPKPAPRRLLGFYVDDPHSIKSGEGDPLGKWIVTDPAQSADKPRTVQVGSKVLTRPDETQRCYFPIDVSSFEQLEQSTAPLRAHNKGWTKKAFASDYDIHEIIVIGGAGSAHPVVSGTEENRLIAALNREIHGDVRLSLRGINSHTVFQHGTQNTYEAYIRTCEPWEIDHMDQRVRERALPLVGFRAGKVRRIMTEELHNEMYHELGIGPKHRWLAAGKKTPSLRSNSLDSDRARGSSPRRQSSTGSGGSSRSQTSSPKPMSSSPQSLTTSPRATPNLPPSQSSSDSRPERRSSTDSLPPSRSIARRSSLPFTSSPLSSRKNSEDSPTATAQLSNRLSNRRGSEDSPGLPASLSRGTPRRFSAPPSQLTTRRTSDRDPATTASSVLSPIPGSPLDRPSSPPQSFASFTFGQPPPPQAVSEQAAPRVARGSPPPLPPRPQQRSGASKRDSQPDSTSSDLHQAQRGPRRGM